MFHLLEMFRDTLSTNTKTACFNELQSLENLEFLVNYYSILERF